MVPAIIPVNLSSVTEMMFGWSERLAVMLLTSLVTLASVVAAISSEWVPI